MRMTAVSAYQHWGQRLRDSDEEAFHELFLESYNPLMRYANTFISDTDVTKDILQEVYAQLWQIRDRIDADKSLKALLYRMTKNRCINYIRSQRTTRLDDVAASDIPSEEMEPMSLDGQSDVMLERKLSEWIEILPERQREAFELSRFDGLDHHEIAKVMDCAPRTVNNHIVSALKTLREKLEQWNSSME